MGTPAASVIIVNWNGKHHLEDCLGSLQQQTVPDFETVLVDNGSTDGSPEYVRQRFPEVRIVPLRDNTGFAGGNNVGYAHCRAPLVVTLNNDTCAEPQWIERLLAAAAEEPEAGMISSRIGRWDDPDVVDSVGVGICPDGMSRGMYRGERFSLLKVPVRTDILLPSGCAALYRRAMLDRTGFFDERFFAYCEDTDLGLRGRLAGWKAVAALDAGVRHRYSGTAGVLSPLKVYLVERNHYWVAAKNFPRRLLAQLPYWTMVRLMKQAALVASGSSGAGKGGVPFSAALRGMKDGLARLPEMVARRPKPALPEHEVHALLRRFRLSYAELLRP